MNWEIAAIIAQMVEAAVIVVTAICGLYKYFHEKKIEKRNRTIEKIGKLIEEYHERFDEKGINTDYKEDVCFLSKVEQFCIAVESKVYCKETVKKYGSKFLTNLYDKYKDTVIATRRKNLKNGIYIHEEISYYYLEELVLSFKQRSSTPKFIK